MVDAPGWAWDDVEKVTRKVILHKKTAKQIYKKEYQAQRPAPTS